jgi:hypothetical protein
MAIFPIQMLADFLHSGKITADPLQLPPDTEADDTLTALQTGLETKHVADTFSAPIAKTLVPTAPNAVNFAGVVPSTEVNGSLVTTISTWVVHSAAGACAIKILASTTAVTGQYATIRPRARSDAAVADTYNVASVEGVSSSASANVAQYADLYGVIGNAQPNAFASTRANGIICGVYSCMDRSAALAGSSWSMWIDDHSTTAKAATSHYLLRMSQNALGGTPVDIDGAITVQTSRLPVLFNFEQVQGFLSDTPGTMTATHKIAVNIAGVGVRYLHVGTVV